MQTAHAQLAANVLNRSCVACASRAFHVMPILLLDYRQNRDFPLLASVRFSQLSFFSADEEEPECATAESSLLYRNTMPKTKKAKNVVKADR